MDPAALAKATVQVQATATAKLAATARQAHPTRMMDGSGRGRTTAHATPVRIQEANLQPPPVEDPQDISASGNKAADDTASDVSSVRSVSPQLSSAAVTPAKRARQTKSHTVSERVAH